MSTANFNPLDPAFTIDIKISSINVSVPPDENLIIPVMGPGQGKLTIQTDYNTGITLYKVEAQSGHIYNKAETGALVNVSASHENGLYIPLPGIFKVETVADDEKGLPFTCTMYAVPGNI